MAEHILASGELNRATLARQGLLARAAPDVPHQIEALAGLQSQALAAPFIGLWSRLSGFERDALAGPILRRQIVKASLMRATLHLVTAADYAWMRPTVAPALHGASAAIAETRQVDVSRLPLEETARAFLADGPRSFADISKMLAERFPGVDVGTMRYTLRTHLPLIQTPVETSEWTYPGNPRFELADALLGAAPQQPDLPRLIRRYLAAYGPATPADMQVWSGLAGLKPAFEALRDELVVLKLGKRELYDLPDAPRPGADVPAPVRFLPEYDNLLLSYKDRTRVVDDAHRPKVFLPALRVAATLLVDGMVRGVWRVDHKRDAATLRIEPLMAYSTALRTEIEAEGEALLRFLAPDAKTFAVTYGGLKD